MFLESVLVGGVLMSCALSGAALANSVHIKRAAANKARRVARGTVDTVLGCWMNGIEVRVGRLEMDEATANRVLNRAGLLVGRAAGDEPRLLRLRRLIVGDEGAAEVLRIHRAADVAAAADGAA